MNREDCKEIAKIIKKTIIEDVDLGFKEGNQNVLDLPLFIKLLADYFEREEVSPIKEPSTDDCQECGGDGVLLSLNTDRNHLEIQRCDNCHRFNGDLEAWEYVRPIFKEKIFDRKQFLKDCGVKE